MLEAQMKFEARSCLQRKQYRDIADSEKESLRLDWSEKEQTGSCKLDHGIAVALLVLLIGAWFGFVLFQ